MVDVLLSVSVSFLSAVACTHAVRIIAMKRRWISVPRKERWNGRRVALMGGIGIFLAFTLAFLTVGFVTEALLVVLSGGVLMFVIGTVDDRFELNPVLKFLTQFLAASILVFFGYTINSAWPFWLSIPLTYLWIVGITNAFNFLDNMDGLAAGIAVIVAFVLAGLALKLGAPTIAVSSFAVGGAAAGFLVFNYNPAKIFMGDCGSLFLGYMLATLPLILEPSLSAVDSASILPVLLAVTILPIFDTTLVTCMRIFKGRPPYQGGSDHSSHRLVSSGLSEKGAVNTLYGITACFGAMVLVMYPGYISLFYFIFSLSVIGLLIFGIYLSRMDIYDDEGLSTMESLVARMPTYFKEKVQLATIIIDVALIIASFVLAHFIRFEGWSIRVENAVIEVLPGIIMLKILILAGVGTYKSVWRYAGVADLLKLFIGALLGTVVSGIFAWVYTGGYLSASVFVIDLLLFTFLLSSSRFAFKGLRRLLAIPNNGGKNILLYGAGDGGWLALSEIRQNRSLKLDPVGFLDDSPYKQHGRIQGLKVLGNISNIVEVCETHEVELLLICIKHFPEEKKQMVKGMCDEHDIDCRKFVPVFNEVEPAMETRQKFVDLQY